MNGLRDFNWLLPNPELLAQAITTARDNAVHAALNTLLPPLSPTDTLLTDPILQIGIATFHNYTEWLPSEEKIWLAWTGPRRRNGEDYHGPILPLNQPNTTYNGPRECACSTCQSTVSPTNRLN